MFRRKPSATGDDMNDGAGDGCLLSERCDSAVD